MRNLKKILALVLALMMVLSVMVTASAATFPDDADIDYKEAVDVMVAAGILKGDGEGNFNPDKALERSSAAKLIAYLMLQEDIDYVDQSATEFGDVPAAHWASGYIAYVAENDIVVGTGAGNYNPNGAVNGYSFAKMVLLAMCEGNKEAMMELDPTAEWNYVTSEWKVAPFTGNYTLKVRLAIAHLKDQGIDLLAGLEKISLNADLTREQAAQLVFNALSAGGDDSVLATVYGLTPVTVEKAGLTYAKWVFAEGTKNEKDATEEVLIDTYVESFASGTTYGAVMAALGVDEKSKTVGQNYYNTIINGGEFECKNFVESKGTVPAAGNLDVYATEEGTLKFMYTFETLEVAAVAKTAETKGDNKGLYKWTFGAAETYAAKDAYEAGAAYLVVIGDNKLVAEPKLAEIVEGKVMSRGTDYVRFADGSKYTFAPGVAVPALKAEKVLYLATDGTVLLCTDPKTAPVVTTETLVYVIGAYSLFVPATTGTPAEKNEYGEIVKEAVAGVPAHWDRYYQVVTMNGEIKSYLYRTGDEADLGFSFAGGKMLRAVTVDAKTGIATLAAPKAESNVISASAITETGKKFTAAGVNYYYDNAEFVQITGTLSKATVTAGTQKAAFGAKTTAFALYSGEGKNMTVTKVFYWTAPSTPSAPTVDPDVFYDMYAVAGTTPNSKVIETLDKDGKTVETDVYLHTVYLSGTPVEIMTYSDKITVNGPASYEIDKYGVTVEIKALENVVSGEVTNLYNNMATIEGGVEDYDISEVTVIDLSTKNANGVVDEGETVVYVYNVDDPKTEKVNEFAVTVIYIIASIEVK